ncbi:hypothetical protein BV283P2_00051 [Phocaeicola phage BV283P2]|nr:hypothetical protein BV283P2_00006 [Phocaeicola phage BV283P2]WAX10602.1 hypothetical protein BV283P2_00051 [Phocaeicola phage BV283P2]
MKEFTVSEAKMLLESGNEFNQIFNRSSAYLESFVQYLLKTCNQRRDRVRLRVRGLYNNSVGFVLEIFFPLEADDDVQIIFDSDVCVDVDDCLERDFCASKWHEIGYESVREKSRNTAGFGSDLYKDKEDKEDVRSYNVGASDYAKHTIQPWDIWREYNLNPWDADIVKRVLRTKKTDGRRLDYEKIIHICKERIRQIDEYGK